MSAKAENFKNRVSTRGQTVTLYSFTAYASGDYVNPDWNAPDPEDPDYPDSGTAPGPSYGDAQSVQAMVQPVSEGESLVRTTWGEEVKVSLKAYFPYDITVAHRDRITYGGVNHLVVGIGEWYDEGDLVFSKVLLKEEVA